MWCSMSIPFLWQEPFLSCLNERSLKIITDIYMKTVSTEFELLKSDTLFDYAKYLRYLNMLPLIKGIRIWATNKKLDCCTLMAARILDDVGRGIIKKSTGLKGISFEGDSHQLPSYCQLNLFKIFLDENPILKSEWTSLRQLYFRGKFHKHHLFLAASKVARCLEDINVENLRYEQDFEALGQLVKKQKQLRRLKLSDFKQSEGLQFFLRGLISEDGGSISRSTLTNLHFSDIDLQNAPILVILNEFPNLESLIFSFCMNWSSCKFRDKTSNIESCHELTTLKIFATSVNIHDVCHILRSASKLQQFELYGLFTTTTSQVLETLAKYSPMLKFLKIGLNDKDFSTFNKTLPSLTNLNHLFIGHDFQSSIYDPIHVGRYLKGFGVTIPSSLRKLDIMCNWFFTPSDLRGFLEGCQADLDYIYFGFCEIIGHNHIKVINDVARKRGRLSKFIYLPLEINNN